LAASRCSAAPRWKISGEQPSAENSVDCTPLWEGVETNPEVLLHFFGSVLQKFDAERALAEISVPVFLSLGRHDYAIPYVLWDKYKNRPGFSYNLFKRSGHSPVIEEPEEFNSRLTAFLKKGCE
jgi:proline iminopeptidase